MNTLRSLVEDLSSREGTAIGVPRAGENVYTYEQLQETTYSFAHVLSEHGVDNESLVGIVPSGNGQTVISVLGAAALGAQIQLEDISGTAVDALVGPTNSVGKYRIPAQSPRIGFGSSPDHDKIMHFEKLVWKTDPTLPEASVLPSTSLLKTPEATFSHRRVIKAAEAAVKAREMDEEMTVVVRSSISDPRTIAAGFIAPLLAGATIRFPTDTSSHGDLAITSEAAPEPRLLLPLDVPLDA